MPKFVCTGDIMKTRKSGFQKQHRLSDTTGAVAVEFAFVIVILLLVMAGMVEFGRIFWYADALTKATRDGARMMSSWVASDIGNGITKAKLHVIEVAAAAHVSPALGVANVVVRCDGTVDCAAGGTPNNVTVSIDNFDIVLGEWFPFIGTNGLISLGEVSLTPHTTMRYMN